MIWSYTHLNIADRVQLLLLHKIFFEKKPTIEWDRLRWKLLIKGIESILIFRVEIYLIRNVVVWMLLLTQVQLLQLFVISFNLVFQLLNFLFFC